MVAHVHLQVGNWWQNRQGCLSLSVDYSGAHQNMVRLWTQPSLIPSPSLGVEGCVGRSGQEVTEQTSLPLASALVLGYWATVTKYHRVGGLALTVPLHTAHFPSSDQGWPSRIYCGHERVVGLARPPCLPLFPHRDFPRGLTSGC